MFLLLRNAVDLSMTVHPAFAAIGAYFNEISVPAAKKRSVLLKNQSWQGIAQLILYREIKQIDRPIFHLPMEIMYRLENCVLLARLIMFRRQCLLHRQWRY